MVKYVDEVYGEFTLLEKVDISDINGDGYYFIKDTVTSIQHAAFSWCWNLRSVSIPNSVTRIGVYAFSHCTNLTSITIPNSVSSIGAGAFFRCTILASITIPNSVKKIGKGIADGCENLKEINIDAANLDEFERIKNLLPNTLQSKVVPFKETHEKMLYKKTQLNEALLYEQSIPLRAQLLSKIGFFSQLEACVIPDVSQLLGATNNITRELDSRLNAIPLKQDIESYKLEVDREINLFREQTLCKRRAESLDTSSITPNKRPRVMIQS